MGAAEQLSAFMTTHLRRFDTNLERAIAAGDVDAVHDFRVASRRLHEPLLILRRWLGGREVAAVERDLRRVRRAFRKVRDLDVLQMHLSEGAGSKPFNVDQRARLEGLLTTWRERALRKAKRRAARLGTRRLVRAVTELASGFRERSAASDAQLRKRVTRQWRRRGAVLLNCAPGSGDEPNLHVSRIGLKRFRYSCELWRTLHDLDRGSLVEALARMQDELGSWNDHVFAARLLARLGSVSKHLVAHTPFAAALLACAADRAAAAERTRQVVLDTWPALESQVRAALAVESAVAPGGSPSPAPAES